MLDIVIKGNNNNVYGDDEFLTHEQTICLCRGPAFLFFGD
jgi:hypothetical protein